MVNTVTGIDWLRIERAVWTLDVLVQDLPGRTRKAIRNEMRANLRAATNEVGAAQAVRRLGGLRRLATDYLEAEYGQDRPRPRWLSAMFWALAVETVLLGFAFVGHSAFISGVEAANPRPSGTYTWNSLRLLGIESEVTYDDQGVATWFGFSFSVWCCSICSQRWSSVVGCGACGPRGGGREGAISQWPIRTDLALQPPTAAASRDGRGRCATNGRGNREGKTGNDHVIRRSTSGAPTSC